MNRLSVAASLSVVLCLASGAQAASTVVAGQLSVQDATGVSFTGYDGAPAQFTGTLDQGFSGTLSALTAGTISFTYLGKEAAYSNAFSFNGQTLFDTFTRTRAVRVAASISGSTRATVPVSGVSTPAAVTVTACPTCTAPSWSSGTAPSTHTVDASASR